MSNTVAVLFFFIFPYVRFHGQIRGAVNSPGSRSAPPPRGTLPPDTADRAAYGRGKKGGKRQLKEGKPTPHPEVAKAQAAAQAAAKKMYMDGKKGKRGPPKRDDL